MNKAELKNRLSTAWQDGDKDDENDAQEVHENEHSRASLTHNGADDIRQNLNGGQRCGGQSGRNPQADERLARVISEENTR